MEFVLPPDPPLNGGWPPSTAPGEHSLAHASACASESFSSSSLLSRCVPGRDQFFVPQRGVVSQLSLDLLLRDVSQKATTPQCRKRLQLLRPFCGMMVNYWVVFLWWENSQKWTRVPVSLRWAYSGTSPIRNSAPLGPYSRTMPRVLWRSQGVCSFL